VKIIVDEAGETIAQTTDDPCASARNNDRHAGDFIATFIDGIDLAAAIFVPILSKFRGDDRGMMRRSLWTQQDGTCLVLYRFSVAKDVKEVPHPEILQFRGPKISP
jgi:hypothetical protein